MEVLGRQQKSRPQRLKHGSQARKNKNAVAAAAAASPQRHQGVSSESKQQQQQQQQQQSMKVTRTKTTPATRVNKKTKARPMSASKAFHSDPVEHEYDITDAAAATMYRMRLRRKKSAAALLKQKGDENFARLATSGLMVSSARRFGRRWVNKMYTAQVAKDKGMYLREMGEGVPRVEVQDPKMLFEFEKYLAVEQVPYHEQGDHMFYVDKVCFENFTHASFQSVRF